MKSDYYRIVLKKAIRADTQKKHRLNKVIHSGFTIFGVLGLLINIVPMHAAALTTNPSAAARISFTFDDGLASTAAQAAPTLAKYGLTGTDYVISSCVGMTSVPNTCRANTDTPYMTWAQIQALQNSSGWEIGSHTVDHQCLASNAAADPGDCQTSTLTTAQVDAELANSKTALAANGITATDFAPPYGDYNNNVLAQISKYYASMRQFKNAANNPNTWPYSDYYLQDQTILETTNTVANVESMVNTAIANNQWLVLAFHNILPNPSTTPDDYEYGTAELDQIAAYVQTKQAAGLINSVHVNQGLVTSDTNLLPNSSFNTASLAASGWTTDNATAVTLDTANNGSYPDPTNSIKFVAGAANSHLFSPKVIVDPTTTYLFKNFINVSKLTSGELAFYVDEYDASGNWISGQYKTAERSSFVEDLNFTYKPSSLAVSKASLQVIDTGGSGITAYFDNPQWFPLTAAVQPTNLVANGTFDAGLAGGWTTDNPTGIIADAANNGSPANPVNSISLTATTVNRHLFSPKVPVLTGKVYSLSGYLNITTLTNNEIGFYVDEYDVNGTWISGHYVTGVRAVGASTVGFNYTPSSSSVKSAALQVIVTANSGIHAYFDDAKWFQN
jgi:peptidoglycan/xylan/chitin deacetylase (PgdA/CDA1 family)